MVVVESSCTSAESTGNVPGGITASVTENSTNSMSPEPSTAGCVTIGQPSAGPMGVRLTTVPPPTTRPCIAASGACVRTDSGARASRSGPAKTSHGSVPVESS